MILLFYNTDRMSFRANLVWSALGVPLGVATCLYYLYRQFFLQKTELKNKVVFITGASSGLGAACAKAFYAAGCKLILSGRDLQKLTALKNELEKQKLKSGLDSHPPSTITIDLQDLPSISPRVQQAVQQCGGTVDILINNAGLSYRGEACSTTLAVDRMLMDVNYFAHVEVTRAVLPYMIKEKKGHIVSIGSVQSRIAIPHRTAYAASKHAFQAYFDTLRSEVAQYGISVCVVNPYYIATNLSTNAVTADGSAYGKMDATTKSGLSPEYVAAEVLRCVRDSASEVTIAPFYVQLAIALRSMAPWLFFKIMEHRARKEKNEMAKNKKV